MSDGARAKFRRAVRALSDGNIELAQRLLESAIDDDPNFASAHLQRAYGSYLRANELDERGRTAFRAATDLRATLALRDRDLLDAIAPSFRDPPSWRDSVHLLGAFTAKHPGDAQGWEALGLTYVKLANRDGVLDACAKARRIDPKASSPAVFASQSAATRGDVVGALKFVEDCLRVSPSTFGCRIQLATLLGNKGDCTGADAVLRDVIELDPDSSRALAWRARFSAAAGAPQVAVVELLTRHRKSLQGDTRTAQEATDAYVVAARGGDFVAAISALDSADQVPNRSSRDLHVLAIWRVQTLWEMGEPRRSAEAAEAFLRRASARKVPERPAWDETGRLLAYAFAGGKSTAAEHIARRDDWIQGWRARRNDDSWLTGGEGNVVWAKAYGTVDEMTPDQARSALGAAATPVSEIPFVAQWGPDPTFGAALDAALGDLLLAAERLDLAGSHLDAAVHACIAVPEVRAQYNLGRLFAKRGERERACEAWATVETTWGRARPKSVTLEATRAASKRLGCPARQ